MVDDGAARVAVECLLDASLGPGGEEGAAASSSAAASSAPVCPSLMRRYRLELTSTA
jgi:hypothetical protein